jgi:hypothetical protein
MFDMKDLLVLKSVLDIKADSLQEWVYELTEQVNSRIINASIDPRNDSDREEYRLLTNDFRLAEMKSNGYNVEYPTYLV